MDLVVSFLFIFIFHPFCIGEKRCNMLAKQTQLLIFCKWWGVKHGVPQAHVSAVTQAPFHPGIVQIPRAAGWAGRHQWLPQTPLSKLIKRWRFPVVAEPPQPWPPPWPAQWRAVQPWQNHYHLSTEIVSVMPNQFLATYWSHKASQSISSTGVQAPQTSRPCTPRPWLCSWAPCPSVCLSVLWRLLGTDLQ